MKFPSLFLPLPALVFLSLSGAPAEPAVVRCLDPYPQTDLFDDWRECVGCSDALQRVKVRCGCVTCDKPLCLKFRPGGSCFRRHQLGNL